MAMVAASSATIVLPLPTSPSSSRCIGFGLLEIRGDFREHALLRVRGLERQDALQRLADFILANAHGYAAPAALALAPLRQRQLVIEKLFEDQTHMRGAAEAVQLFEIFVSSAGSGRRAALRAAWEIDSARECSSGSGSGTSPAKLSSTL